MISDQSAKPMERTMTKPKRRKKPSRPHYQVHRRSRRKKPSMGTRFVLRPVVDALKNIRQKIPSEQSFPKLQNSTTTKTEQNDDQ